MLSRSRLITAPDQLVALQFHRADVSAFGGA